MISRTTSWVAIAAAAAAALAGSDVHAAASQAESARAALRTKQFEEALRTLRSAAAGGDSQSQYLLGLAYASGIGTPVNTADARRWLTAAAEHGNCDAAYALAGLLATSAADRASAQDWLERAAKAGHPTARRLSAAHALPLAPARSAQVDVPLRRELLFWAVRHDDFDVTTELAPQRHVHLRRACRRKR